MVPSNKSVFIFDPYQRLVENEPIIGEYVGVKANKILVNLAGEMIRYKSYELDDFELILDFSCSLSVGHTEKIKMSFINRKDGSLRWMFSKRSLSFLKLYQPFTKRSKVLVTGMRLLHLIKASRLFVSGFCNVIVRPDVSACNHIKILGFNYAFSGGSKGFGNTPIVFYEHSGHSYFVKISKTALTRELQNHELKMNGVWKNLNLNSVSLPKVNSFSNYAIVNGETQKIQASKKLSKSHVVFLKEVMEKSVIQLPFQQSRQYLSIVSNIDLLHNSKSKVIPHSPYLGASLEEILAELKGNQVLMTKSHGDFTPWNTSNSGESLYLIDFELASNYCSMLSDFFHFIIQRGVLINNNSWQAIECTIWNEFKKWGLEEYVQKWDIDPVKYLKYYLLDNVSFQLAMMSCQSELSVDQLRLVFCWQEAFRGLGYGVAENDRISLIRDLCIFLEGKRHTFIKQFVHPLEISLEADLDILVSTGLRKETIEYLKMHPGISKIKVVTKSYLSQLMISLLTGEVLYIDLISKMVCKGKQYLNEEVLINSSMKQLGVMRPKLQFELENCILFYGLNKGCIPEKYQELFQRANWLDKGKAVRYFNSKYMFNYQSIDELLDLTPSKSRYMLSVFRSSFSLKKKVTERFVYFFDTLRQLINNRGFICTISGVDGVGKTTIVQELEDRLKKQFRKEVVLLRHRPNLLPILSAYQHGKDVADKRASINLPRQGTNESVVSSIFRFGYYYLDYLLGQIYVAYKYTWRGKIVLYDRYYFDFINDAKRSNISLSPKLVKLFYGLVRKPEMNFYLYASPEVILSRKQEMTANQIRILNLKYQQLFSDFSSKYKGVYRSIENNDKKTTINIIIEELSLVA